MQLKNHLPYRAVYLFVFLFTSLSSFSQTTGYSGTGANIDVKYHRFEWTIDPTIASKTISGTVTTYFETLQNNVSAINFDFTKASFNNGSLVVKYHGSSAGVVVSFPASGNVNIINIALPVTLPINTLDSVSITYSGVPPNFATYGEGMDKQTITGLGTAMYTLAESYGDDDFWPCKADMQDRIDSTDFIITTPLAYRAAANGALVSDVTTATTRTMTYKHRYSIPSYLVAVAVAQYTVYNRTPVTIGSTSVPITYYIGSGRTPTAGNLTTMDRCRDELVAFSNVFGDYPFKNEKYGMYEFGWGGGMEHQTFSAMSWGSMTSWSVIAHELAHQWFGDKVTFSTWNHLWLAEGFARYSEALAAELVPALGQNAATVRNSFKTVANNTSYRTYSCYLPDASIINSNTIWNSAYGTTVYERGAMVVSMLRTLLGDDKFFLACRNYLNDPALAYRSATTDDLRNHMQAAAGGYDLTNFFNSWVYGNGYPNYNAGIGWSGTGTNRIVIQVTAPTKSTGSTVGYYYTPIALRVRGALASQDTVIVVYDQNGQLSRAGNGISAPVTGNVISFNLNFNPTSVSFDPFSQTLASGITNLNSTLDVNIVDFRLEQNEIGNKLILSLTDSHNELDKVILQKSRDGITYTDAGLMEKVQTGNSAFITFSYTDYNAYPAETFYRAKVKETALEKYSRVLKAENKPATSLILFPNPADRQVYIRWAGVSGTETAITIISMDGKAIREYKTTSNYLSINTTDLPAGGYMVQVKRESAMLLNRQLIIKR